MNSEMAKSIFTSLSFKEAIRFLSLELDFVG